MARLTDSDGRLLGGLHTPSETFSLTELFPPFLRESKTGEQTSDSAPPAATIGPEEIVPALECSYGSFTYLTYSAGIANPAAGVRQPQSYARDCVRLVEQPEARHYCPACHGYYCATHAKPTAHDCSAIVVTAKRAA